MTPLISIAELAPDARARFEQAGWYPARQAEKYVTARYPPAIQAVERELGGLIIGASDRKLSFTSAEDMENLGYYNGLLGRPLYPIGQTDEYWDLCIDEHGSLYMLDDRLILLGMTFNEGIVGYLTWGWMSGIPFNEAFNEDDLTWGAAGKVITWPSLATAPPAPLLPPYDFPPDIRPLLEAAGWYPGRVADPPVELPGGLHYPPAVRALLQELGGLLVSASGTGQTVARAGLDFTPLAAAGDCDDNGLLAHYITQHNGGHPYRGLYPIGELWQEQWLMLVDLAGGVYVAADDLWQVGESVAEGLANLLRGVRGRHVATWPHPRVSGGLECPTGPVATANSRPGPADASGTLPADLHPQVAAVLHAHYVAHGPGACGRAHGYCPDAQLLSEALRQGWPLHGAVTWRVRVRAPDNPRAQAPVPACPSCQALFRHFGVRDGVRPSGT